MLDEKDIELRKEKLSLELTIKDLEQEVKIKIIIEKIYSNYKIILFNLYLRSTKKDVLIKTVTEN